MRGFFPRRSMLAFTKVLPSALREGSINLSVCSAAERAARTSCFPALAPGLGQETISLLQYCSISVHETGGGNKHAS